MQTLKNCFHNRKKQKAVLQKLFSEKKKLFSEKDFLKRRFVLAQYNLLIFKYANR